MALTPVTGSIGFTQTTWVPLQPTPATYGVGPGNTPVCPEVAALLGDGELSTAGAKIYSGVPGILSISHVISSIVLPLSTPGSGQTSISFTCSYLFSNNLEASSTPATTDPNSSETTRANGDPKSTTSASKATGCHKDESSPISTGAISGIGVGAFALGIAVGLAAASCWLFSRRRSRKNEVPSNDERSAMLSGAPIPPPKDPSPSSQTQSSPRIGPAVSAAVLPATAGLEQDAVKGASDEEIASELAFLGQLIKDHAKNNYHLQPLDVDPNVIRHSLEALNLDEMTQHQIAILSLEPQTRYVAIRHLLALSIFSALDMHFVDNSSLLPPGVVAFISNIPMDKADDSKAFTTALNKWREATVSLLHENNTSTNPLTLPPSAKSQITTFQATLNKFLSQFIHQDSRAVFDQTKNLEGVIQECVAFGYSIFSHPCLWRYTYQMELSDSEKTSLVVLPGLEKLSGRDGAVLEHGEVVVSPSVVKV